jgi:sialidase-1
MKTHLKQLIQLMYVILFVAFTFATSGSNFLTESEGPESVKKLRDLIIYKDPVFYSAFPSVIKKPDGELLVAFRRAPERRIFGENKTTHIDPNSYLVTVSSYDNGETWSNPPKLLYAHYFGGSQDPCMVQLRDGTILCTSYGWATLRLDNISNIKECVNVRPGGEAFLGGHILMSADGGKNWEGPIYPPPMPGGIYCTPMGDPKPVLNRGAMCEGKDGRIFWSVADKVKDKSVPIGNYLFISNDKGLTWEYSCPVATDDKVVFNETSLYETPKGDLVAFMRTANFEDQACIARSTDGGKSFQHWKSMGFQGHPLYALSLPDNRVFLVYGYRHEPYGIRARILNSECNDYETAEEIIIRTDGGSGDIGYPWAVMLDEKRVLVTYYFNIENGTRHIAGSILKID